MTEPEPAETPAPMPEPGSAPASTHTDRPLVVSAVLAVLVATLAVLFVAHETGQLGAAAFTLLAVLAIAVGVEFLHRGSRVVGVLLPITGVVTVLIALTWGFMATETIQHRLQILPAVVGLVVLALGLVSTVKGRERTFLTLGTVTVLVVVFISGLAEEASVFAMLAATTGTIVAWDVGEQAINMGEQVGREARTWPTELVHGGASVVVGSIGVAAAMVLVYVNIAGLPLAALLALLAAAIVLAGGLHR